MNGLKINASDENFGLIVNCAVRYAIGRQTYIVSVVINFAKSLLKHLSDKTLACLVRDIETTNDYGDEAIDKTEWLKFLKEIKAEQKNREDKNKNTLQCPFCEGNINILVYDKEGNIHDDEYEKNPYNGLSYAIEHLIDDNPSCPIAHYRDDILGTLFYDSREELIKSWNSFCKE